MSIRGFSDLEDYLLENKIDPKGILVDTSVLIAASYGPDNLNEDCEKAFKILVKNGISIYTNVNVKNEFLEAQRRITLSEALVDFDEVYSEMLPEVALKKLKSHKQTYRDKIKEKQSTKMTLQQIEVMAALLRPIKIDGRNAWKIACEDFLEPNLSPVWNNTVKLFRIQELRVREADKSPLLEQIPDWDDAIKLMGKHCLGSTDSMIVNMFKCSKLKILFTADKEMARCAAEEVGSKEVFMPDDELKKLNTDLTNEV